MHRFQRLLVAIPLLLAALATGCSTRPPDPPWIPGEIEPFVSGSPLVTGVAGWGDGPYVPFVNLYTGNLFVCEPMVRFQALGPDWNATLYYNSALATELTPVGLGWRLSYDSDLKIDTPAPTLITVDWGDGRSDVYSPNGIDTWAGSPALLGNEITLVASEYSLRDKHGMLYVYDSNGRLVRIVDRNFNTMTLSYDLSGHLVTIADASGRTLTLSYAGDKLIAIGGFIGGTYTFAYSGDLLRSVTDPAAATTSFEYNAGNFLVAAVDAAGNRSMVRYYSSAPAVVKLMRAPEALRSFDFNPYVHETTVVDSIGVGVSVSTTYGFDGNGLAVTVRDPLGNASDTYDPTTHVLTAYTDTNGRTISWTVDPVGNVTSRTDQAGGVRTWAYEPTYNLCVAAVDAAGNPSSCTLDANGNTLTEVDRLGRISTYTYDGQGQMLTARSPRGSTMTFGWDVDGNLVTMVDPNGGTVTASYDSRSLPVTIVDQEANTITIGYDARGDIAQVQQASGNLWLVARNIIGRMERLTDPANGVTQYFYNGMNRPVRVMDPVGAVTTASYDGTGHLVALMDALGRTETIARDLVGRATQRTDADGGLWQGTPAAGDMTQYASTTDPVGNFESRIFDPRYLCTQVARPGNIDSRSFDARGLLVAASRNVVGEPLVSYSYGYDAAGQLLTQNNVHVGRTVTFGYDQDGNLTVVNDNLRPAGAVSFAWGSREEPTSVVVASPPFSANLTHTARMQPQSINWSNGTISNFAYNVDGQVKSIQHVGGFGLSSYTLDREPRGQVSHVVSNTPAGGALEVFLPRDPLGRVQDESYVPGPGASAHYGWDFVGNRTNKMTLVPPSNETYAYSPGHRLLNTLVPGSPFNQIWNAAGRVTHTDKLGVVLDYTYRNDRSLATINVNGQIYKFLQGPSGELVRVVAPGGAQTWFCEDVGSRGQLARRVELSLPSTVPLNEYVYAPNLHQGHGPMPLLWMRSPYTPSTPRSVHIDRDGVALVTSQTGALVWSRIHDSFGKTLAQAGSSPPRQTFQALDEVAGLGVQFGGISGGGAAGAAPYNPATGSWQVDGGFGTDSKDGAGEQCGRNYGETKDGEYGTCSGEDCDDDGSEEWCDDSCEQELIGEPTCTGEYDLGGGGTVCGTPFTPEVPLPPQQWKCVRWRGRWGAVRMAVPDLSQPIPDGFPKPPKPGKPPKKKDPIPPWVPGNFGALDVARPFSIAELRWVLAMLGRNDIAGRLP